MAAHRGARCCLGASWWGAARAVLANSCRVISLLRQEKGDRISPRIGQFCQVSLNIDSFQLKAFSLFSSILI